MQGVLKNFTEKHEKYAGVSKSFCTKVNMLSHVLKDLFIWETQLEKEGETEKFSHILVYFLAPQRVGPGWSQEVALGLTPGGRDPQTPGPFSTAFPRPLADTGITVGQLRHEPASHRHRPLLPSGSLCQCLQLQVWAMYKPGAGSPLKVSHMSGRSPNICAISCCLPGTCELEARIRAGWDLNPDIPTTRCRLFNSHFNCYPK